MRYLIGLLACIHIACWSASAAAQQTAQPQPQPQPQRIASLNLCTDLLLLELVAPERIVSLTYWAADPDLSYLAEEVGDIPLNHSLAEEIVPKQPDLVLAGQYSNIKLIDLLRRLDYRVEVVDVPVSLADMREHILAFGVLVGEQEKAETLADQLDRRMARVSAHARTAPGPAPLAVVYGPQGVSPGSDTLMDELLGLAGFRNLAAEQGIASYGTLSLEALVRANPDLLILDDLSPSRDSVAHQALHHPALLKQFEPGEVANLPPSLTACVGPTSVEAAERLLSLRLGQ